MSEHGSRRARLRKIADRLEDAGCVIEAAEGHAAAEALEKLVPSAHENRRLLDLAERGAPFDLFRRLTCPPPLPSRRAGRMVTMRASRLGVRAAMLGVEGDDDSDEAGVIVSLEAYGITLERPMPVPNAAALVAALLEALAAINPTPTGEPE